MKMVRENTKSAIEEIVDWSEKLPDWQSDALRRILKKNNLDETDVDEVYRALKYEHKLIKLDDLAVSPIRLTSKDIPRHLESGVRITLKAISNLENVNAIDSDQSLEFDENGLTIIYGNNAAGKSGYARVIKKACRARGVDEAILPHVFNDKDQGAAKAKFIYIENGSKKEIQWVDGEVCSDRLATINVFDSKCARVYVDKENDVAYVPYGLDVFDKLSQLSEKLKSLLESEIANINIDKTFLDSYLRHPILGPLISSLDSQSSYGEIEKRVALTDDEGEKYKNLDTKIAELRLNDPQKKADGIRRTISRFSKLKDSMLQLEFELSLDVVDILKRIKFEHDEAQEVAKATSNQSFKNEPLQGVGSDVWKKMFEYARQYSEEQAYPNQEFPITNEGSKCLLCQQSLNKDAADRLKRFNEFVKNKAESDALTKKEKYIKLKQAIEQLNVSPLENDQELIYELEKISNNLADSVKAFFASTKLVHAWFTKALMTNSWSDKPEFTDSSFESMTNLIVYLTNQANEYEQASKPEERRNIEQEHFNFDQRVKFLEKREQVETLIGNLRKISLLEKCIEATNTLNITRKCSDMMKVQITENLKQNLKKEFEQIHIDYINIDLNKRGRAGVTFHKFRLKSRTHANATISDVLSEGEQKAIAVASFLAEIRTSPDKSSIVFDDPVSSLDHVRREDVAKRLVREAFERQVIIFTHDIVFLMALSEHAEKKNCPAVIQTVWANSSKIGLCDLNAPWIGQKTKDRIKYLRNVSLPKIYKHHKDSQLQEWEDATKRAYGRLRDTWERLIEEYCFNDAVKRFSRGIETQRLKSVQFDDGDFNKIDKCMTKCSDHLHDQSPEINAPTPEPSELERDIKELDDFVSMLKTRNEKTRKKR